jgi:tRNA pseudouridine synthase 10
MAQGAEEKQKQYTCVVWASRALTAGDLEGRLAGVRDMVIKQRTPVRVMHRRALLVRDKVSLRPPPEAPSLTHSPQGVHDSYPRRPEKPSRERVLRGGCACRVQVIHSMRCELLAPHFFILHVRTSAGTYIKEFVHGDLGR